MKYQKVLSRSIRLGEGELVAAEVINTKQLKPPLPAPEFGLTAPLERPLAEKLRPEAQLLLLCARSHANAQELAQIRSLLERDLDWEFILTKAHEHCVSPLVFRNLERAGDARIPRRWFAQLRARVANNTRFNLFRAGELVRLLRLLQLNGVLALPFKGPVLSVLAYGNLALREYGDLDLLVRPEDVSKTAELLSKNGYHLATELRRSQTNRKFVSRNKDLIFENESQSVRIELHWRLTGKHFSFPLELRQLWGRLDHVSLAGTTVPTLGNEDLLLYLCSHGSRHGWERIIWICDVAELLRACPEIDWDRVVTKARALGGERLLALGLILVRDLLGVEVPPVALNSIRIDDASEALAAEIGATLFDEHQKDISYWCNLHLRLRERRIERLRLQGHYLWRYARLALTPNDRDHLRFEIDGRLSFLYYVLRPFRLVSELGLPRARKLLKR